MGEEDTKVAVEPTANGTGSLQKTPDAISAQENVSGKETHETKKDEDTGPEKMEIDEGNNEAEDKEAKVTEQEKKVETEKTEEKDDNEGTETAKMDEDTDGKKLKAEDGVSGGDTEEDTVMKESDDNKDIKDAGNQEMDKIDTTKEDQEKTEEEKVEGGKVNGKEQGNKEDIKEDEKLVGGEKGDSVDKDEKMENGDTINKEEEPKEADESELAGDGKEEETSKEEEAKEPNKEEDEKEPNKETEVEADAEVHEPKVEDEKAENENEIDDSKDEKEEKEEETKEEKEDEKEESDDDKEDEKEESNDDKNEDSKKSNKRGKGKTKKVRRKTKSEEEKKDIEPRTPFSDRPVRERKSVERLVALVDKDSSKEFQVAKGKGTPLKDIPNVAYKLTKKKSDEVIKLLHTTLFGRRGKAANFKTNLLRFSGYTWQGDEGKAKDKAKERLDKCNKEKLLEFCDIFDISVANTTRKKKEDVVAKLFEFLEKPHATTDVLIDEKEKGAKRKRTPKKSSPAAGSSSSKRSAKVLLYKVMAPVKEDHCEDSYTYMGFALHQAKLALEALEVPVGCVILEDGKVIASGRNRTNETRNATRHAEMEAIDQLIGQWRKNRLSPSQVAEKFSKCVLYVTCEPCIMCASALSFLAMKEVYYGCANDKFGGCGSILSLHLGNSQPSDLVSTSDEYQRGKGYKCIGGIMAEEAVSLFKCFYEQGNPNAPRPHRPVVQRERGLDAKNML